MAVRIVEQYPGRAGRGIGRFFVALLALLLLLIGLIAAALVVMFAVGMALPDVKLNREYLTYWGGSAAVALIGIVAGQRLLRGRRRLGLFLRRFGYSEATGTISAVVAGGVGRSWRMVTLDDSKIAAQGTRSRYRAGGTTAIVIGVILIGLVLLWAFGGSLDSFQSGLDTQVNDTTNLGSKIAGAIVTGIIFVFVVLFFIAVGSIALVAAVVGGVSRSAAKAAQRRASVRMTRPDDVERTAGLIKRYNRRVLAARLVVCSVTDELWQSAVRRLAAVSDAVVIDVSEATDNLVWEVQTMRATPGGRWVLVCHRDKAAPLSGHSPAATQAEVRLAGLLDGQEVLVYGTDKAAQRRFARSLRNRLDAAARA